MKLIFTTDPQRIEFKSRLRQSCIVNLEQRIRNSATSMDNAQAAANEEEKSSAGDKYETSRAMSHLEKDMHAKQLEENKNALAILLGINCERIYERVEAGCIINCDEFVFFMAAGIGKTLFEDELIFLLSAKAPLSKILYNKTAGDTFEFNGKSIVIKEIF